MQLSQDTRFNESSKIKFIHVLTDITRNYIRPCNHPYCKLSCEKNFKFKNDETLLPELFRLLGIVYSTLTTTS